MNSFPTLKSFARGSAVVTAGAALAAIFATWTAAASAEGGTARGRLGGAGGPSVVTAATPCDSVAKYPYFQEVLFTSVKINGGSAHGTVVAGDPFTVEMEYYVQDCIDPGFAKEVVVGFPHDAVPICIFNQAITCEGTTAVDTVTMTAPLFAGDYAIGFDVWEDPNAFVCSGEWTNGPPDASRYLACITVLPGNQPVITTGPATGVTASGASVSGTVDPNGFTSTIRFVYGTSPSSYSDSAIAVGSPVSGTNPSPVSLTLGGLTANTRYYYTISATNINGVFHGPKLSFYTGPQFGMVIPVYNLGKMPYNGVLTDSVTILNTGNMTLQLGSITSANPLVSVSPTSGSVPPLGATKLGVTIYGLTYGAIKGDLVVTHNGTTTPDTQKVTAGVYSGTVVIGWNIVSVPLNAPNYAKVVLFPNSISNASRFSGGYINETTLDNGIGYWLKFPAAESTVVDGGIRTRDTATVVEGWNMIGTPTLPVPLDSISTTPPGIISSPYFRYNGGYQPVSELLPVRGYWVKATGPGTVIMRSQLTEVPPAAGRSDAAPEPATATGRIDITDAAGGTARLYTRTTLRALPGGAALSFELPPAPPDGIFDARFEDGSYAVATGGEFHAAVRISSAAYPATVAWSFDDPSLRLILNGSPAGAGPIGSVTLESSRDMVSLGRGREGGALPRGFSVSQYPNPFNPTTHIRYELPVRSHVRIVIFDALGREVEELFSGEREAGSWEVEFDASQRPSGVYLYRVVAGASVSGGKMLLVR